VYFFTSENHTKPAESAQAKTAAKNNKNRGTYFALTKAKKPPKT